MDDKDKILLKIDLLRIAEKYSGTMKELLENYAKLEEKIISNYRDFRKDV